jgi:predicted PurR-regulated permease PerM
MDRARVLVAIGIGLAITIGMWLLGIAASGFVSP